MLILYGGIEGGTTNSRMVIIDEQGKLLGASEGPHTNHWLLGLKEAAKRLTELTKAALRNARIPENTTLSVLGLSLSGVDTKEISDRVIKAVLDINPKIATKIYACNDSLGTWATVTDSEAIVLIAGTGSICTFMKNRTCLTRIGGLGHILGDQGSAFWIAREAIIFYIKVIEGLVHSNYGIKKLHDAIQKHFDIKHHHDILPYFNEKFDKKFIAKLCVSLAEAAHEGDHLCKRFFKLAGFELGQLVRGALRYAKQKKLLATEEVDVWCCGAVFKSWDLLEKGFKMGLKPIYSTDCRESRLSINLLQVTAAYGATIIAAQKEHGICLPRPSNSYTRIAQIDLSKLDVT